MTATCPKCGETFEVPDVPKTRTPVPATSSFNRFSPAPKPEKRKRAAK